jgi:uncharacterized protein
VDLLAVLSGFAVGAIVGVTGVGGGSLMTPLLMTFFGLSPAVAVGTDLWFAALTKATGAVAHHRQGNVDARVTGLLLAGSLPAALVTLGALHTLGPAAGGLENLRDVIGVALLLTAVAVALRPVWARWAGHLSTRSTGTQRAALTVISGAALGVLVTLTSIGAGALGATLILLLHPLLPARRLVGTDIAHAVPLTLVAAIGHSAMGHVDVPLLLALLLGSLPGIALGARLSRRLPEPVVRALLCACLLAAGARALA